MSYRSISQEEISDDIACESLSTNATPQHERPERLHEWLTANEIEQIRKVFFKHPEQKLNQRELRDALIKLNITFTDSEFLRLFLRINQNQDYKCDWDEFISHLIFGFQEDDPSTQKEVLIQPISVAPIVKKSLHRSPIVGISQLKELASIENASEEEATESRGIYVTASKEGFIRFWSTQLEPLRTAHSETCYLKMPTWILVVQALSDVSVVCTSSTERELRFHESTTSTFSLRIVIRSMPFAVCCMSYNYHPTGDVMSKLCLGDYGGNVRILGFSPFLRGPFQSKPGTALVELFWSEIVKGKYSAFQPREYINIHSELIQHVFFSIRLNTLFASAEYRNTKKYHGRCPGLIMTVGSEQTVFKIPLGVTAFYIDDANHILATGGPDTYLRLWDIYIPSKPSAILTGHNGGIIVVFIQPEEQKVYSVDYLKIIKVWHLTEHTLLQTFGDLAHLIAGETDLAYYYNKRARELLVGGRKIVSVKCCPRMRMDLTDGNTHAHTVSVVLYNRLFRNVVTCGLDSYIIVWDPWTGRRLIIMKSCHTKMVYGEVTDIEITAACFDPLEQFLLTGARDGSLKIWNYNNAVCIRNMNITKEHEVTAVAWVVDRILAVGWDRHITEFADVEGREYSDPKMWPTYHDDDVTCADVKLGEGVVTATNSGELILWKLETGQPYRRYNVEDPTKYVELIHKKKPKVDESTEEANSKIRVSLLVRKSVSATIRTLETKYLASTSRKFRSNPHDGSVSLKSLSTLEFPTNKDTQRPPTSVQALLFLQTRPMTKIHGSLFVALDSGMIQVYSNHQLGGYITEFNAIHKTGDCVLTMATDRKNRFLFTGTALGYIKIWLVQNYCIPKEEHTHISMPNLRLQFIFMRSDRFVTRPKRAVRHQPEPMLLSSYKGHLKAITSIVYINQTHILLSGSHDFSCRLWSLGGRYLGTLGTPLQWMRLSPFERIDESRTYRLPPDIKKMASLTTLKVLSGTHVDKLKEQQDALKMEDKYKAKDDTDDGENDTADEIFGKPLREPVLGKHFDLPKRGPVAQQPVLDTTLSYIPVYSHLKVHEASEVTRPPTPEAIRKAKKKNFMQYYETPSK